MLNTPKELVVNWHITEACNYKCDYCFAKWNDNSKEILHSQFKVEALLKQIENIRHLLNKKSNTVYFDKLRINLVGGETFLYRRQLKNIVNLSKEYDFKLSAITNGSLFNVENIELIAKNFSSIGISVDSLNEQTNLAIGRTSKKGVFNPSEVLTAINYIKEHNPNIEIKINTVVNKLNISEDLSNFIAQAQPKKWKIFKLLPVYSNKLEILNQEFSQFLGRHSNFESIISAEDNNDMTESYLMIDPLGRFFQNGPADGYNYSAPLWETSAEIALQQINFDSQKFINRYKRII
ncbi:viperin family antiviral radical SAM protein [Acinetobacter sp. SM34]|uniref:viperin family antiviral radical SAM protein n=1 Tax=Acinetobacter sp. SM34 TaxID=1301620 RepID=UPI001EDC449E|nr:viperin family antiviral radical SAM protein [Acinetobacter sp. SM34]MCG2607928.1 viperin family antiviral radical SAM protein [Acinetobacter sp. SM34]